MNAVVLFTAILAIIGQLPTIIAQEKTFTADVLITNDPKVTGTLSGVYHYQVSMTEGPDVVKRVRIDYVLGQSSTPPTAGPHEIIDETDTIRYLYCPGTPHCDAETFNGGVPRLWSKPSDVPIPALNEGNCLAFERSNETAKYIWLQDVGTATERTCKVAYPNGKTFTFSGHRALSGNTGAFTEWNCPEKQCSLKLDVMLVLDESGSVSIPDFNLMKQFGVDFANSFTIGPLGVLMGVVMFASSSRTVVDLSGDQTVIVNSIQALTRLGGATCIPCGMERAELSVLTYGRPLSLGVTRVMVVLTDGGNNVRTSELPGIAEHVKVDSQFIVFAIAVGPGPNMNQIQTISSTIPGVQTIFDTSSFSGLSTILDGLVVATCLDIAGTPCGAGCNGFCSCQATCVCPDICADGTCFDPKCDSSTGFGCGTTPTSCNDGNACTADSCNPATGCVHSTITCNDNKDCTVDGCNPSFGCTFAPVSCDDDILCTQDIWDPEEPSCCINTLIPGCTCAEVDCSIVPGLCNAACDPVDGICKSYCPPSGSICSNNLCNATTGQCEAVKNTTVCDDGNACTLDECKIIDQQTNEFGCVSSNITCEDKPCFYESCDPAVIGTDGTGCIWTPRVCDDLNPCTNDVCNHIQFGSGECGHPIRDCTQDLIGVGYTFPDQCTIAVCANNTGCKLLRLTEGYDECNVCNGAGNSCILGTGQVAVLGGAVIAALIAAIIAVLAAVGVFGSKKGLELYRKTQGNMGAAQANPLYASNETGGDSPLYVE